MDKYVRSREIDGVQLVNSMATERSDSNILKYEFQAYYTE